MPGDHSGKVIVILFVFRFVQWKYYEYINFQSEQEKKLLKQVRREEQKSFRRNKIDDRDLENHEEYLKTVGFDPEMMKYHRLATSVKP